MGDWIVENYCSIGFERPVNIWAGYFSKEIASILAQATYTPLTALANQRESKQWVMLNACHCWYRYQLLIVPILAPENFAGVVRAFDEVDFVQRCT
jgi:hypothetical protein